MFRHLPALLGPVLLFLFDVIQDIGLITATMLDVKQIPLDDVIADNTRNILYTSGNHNDGVAVNMDFLPAAQAPDSVTVFQSFLPLRTAGNNREFHREFDLLFLAHI